MALAALRKYLHPSAPGRTAGRPPRGSSRIDALVAAAKADRVYTVLRPYLEALA